MAHAFSSLMSLLPRGDRLPRRRWELRHRSLTAVAALHVPVLFAWGLIEDVGLGHMVLELTPIAAMVAFALVPRAPGRAREVATALALLISSALIVHLMNGAVEAHFHLFLVVSLLALYEQWLPFLVAILFVAVHHLGLGLLDDGAINHAAAQAHPVRWAVIHALFIAAQAAIVLASWKLNEDSRASIAGAEARYRWQAHHDRLTGLPNREQALRRLDKAAHAGSRGSVLLIDVDDFGLVNDSLGHAAGDELLRGVAARLEQVIEERCERWDGLGLLGRFGGDEFVVVSPEADPAGVCALAQDLVAALREPFVIAGAPLEAGITTGARIVGDDAVRSANAILGEVHAALDHARAEGKGAFAIFDESMRRRAAEQLQIEHDVRHAAARGELSVVYQPQIDLIDGSIHGVEALLRWTHPELGCVSPADFIPIAERNGAIIEIGAWVLDAACRQAADWDARRLEVSVNVSSRQLAAPGFVEVVRDTLARHGVAPGQLCLEVTETAVLGDPVHTRRVLGALTELGVQLAVDDFGVGFASLAHLRQLMPVDVLKIDKSFIDGVLQDPEDAAIVTGVIRLAHSLGLSVVAEGVEHAEQAELLRSWDCEFGQGYHFARPLPPGAVTELLGAEPKRVAVHA